MVPLNSDPFRQSPVSNQDMKPGGIFVSGGQSAHVQSLKLA